MELRRDYLTEQWVLIAETRGKRPQPLQHRAVMPRGVDVFAPGNEHRTPPEIGRRGGKQWTFRWFANQFPVVDVTGNAATSTTSFFTSAEAYGLHEIIVETPSSTQQLWDVPASRVHTLFTIYNERIEALSRKPNIRYVTVFKNHGAAAGASLLHSHTQIIATAVVPPIVQTQLAALRKNPDAYASIIRAEKNGPRFCFENKTAIAFAPYASQFNYELWIFPKRHRTRLCAFSSAELRDFTALLHCSLQRLKTLNAAYNYCIYYAPTGTQLRCHLRLMPRISLRAGFEMASGIIINEVPPERAAAFYRGEGKN